LKRLIILVKQSSMSKLKVDFKGIYNVLFNTQRESIIGAMVHNGCNPIDVVLRKLICGF
jgi:hypothetical protein